VRAQRDGCRERSVVRRGSLLGLFFLVWLLLVRIVGILFLLRLVLVRRLPRLAALASAQPRLAPAQRLRRRRACSAARTFFFFLFFSSSSSSSGTSGSPGIGCGSAGFIGLNSGKMSGRRLGLAFTHSCGWRGAAWGERCAHGPASAA
jgi:hypothetical protein